MHPIIATLCATAAVLASAPAVADEKLNRKPGTSTLAQIIAASPDHNVLEFALDAAGLDAALEQPDARLTVFAPTDAAFARVAAELGYASVDELAGALVADGLLDDVLLYHVVDGRRFSNSLFGRKNPRPIETLLGQFLVSRPTLQLVDGTAATSDARVTAANLSASNGVLHVIDNVLVP
jgi:uncharacterized surface protein with fasciclin (FAS1) repeats